MSNSPLVTYKRITKNRTSPRNHKIDTITIHCYVGQVTAKQGCDNFATTSRQVSANYVVGYDGSIGLSVDEKDRSWCSGGKDKQDNPIRVNGISGGDNDHRAITIEVASDTKAPYAITDKAYKALVNLVADICKRNGIKELKWQGKKSLVGQVDKQNMTVHRWFANKACPGDYLYNLHGQIAKEVNAKLAPAVTKPAVLYRVQSKPFRYKKDAVALQVKLKSAGFTTCLVKVGSNTVVQVGAYKGKTNADSMLKKLKNAGFNMQITTSK